MEVHGWAVGLVKNKFIEIGFLYEMSEKRRRNSQ